MPTYDNEIPLEQMREVAKKNRCGECGGDLSIAWGGSLGYEGYILRCANDISHNTLKRPFNPSPYDVPGLVGFNLTRKRREQMEKRLGEEKAGELVKYAGKAELAKAEVMAILKTIWPDAPELEMKRAVLLCVNYNLNPLMNHVFLVPFNKGKPTESWATILGIKAKRLLAARKKPFSYIDNTPRVMTKEEQEAIFGQVEPEKLWVITKLQDPQCGAISVGYGWWPKGVGVYGDTKGNTPFNMASIRSESQALDRLRPGEMPTAVGVADEAYVGQLVDTTTGEIVEGGYVEEQEEAGAERVPPPQDAKAEPPQEAEAPEQPKETPPSAIDDTWLQETLDIIHWKEATALSWIKAQLKVPGKGTLLEVLNTLDADKLKVFVEHIRLMREAA